MNRTLTLVRTRWPELAVGALFVVALGLSVDVAMASGRGSSMLSGSFGSLPGDSPKTQLYGVVPPGGYNLELYPNSEPGKFLGVVGKPDIGQAIAGVLLWVVNLIWLLTRMVTDLCQTLLELGFRTDLAGTGSKDASSVMADIYDSPIVKFVWGLGVLVLTGRFIIALGKGNVSAVMRQTGVAVLALVVATVLIADRGRAIREVSSAVATVKQEVLGVSKDIVPPAPAADPSVEVDGLGAAQDAIANIAYLQPWMVMQTGGVMHCAVVLNEDAFDGDTKPPGGWPSKFDDPDEEVKRIGLAWPCRDRGQLVAPATKYSQVKSGVKARVSRPIKHTKYVRDLLYNENPARQGAAIAIRDGLTSDQASKLDGEQYGVERKDLRVKTKQSYGPADMPAADAMFSDEMVLERAVYAIIALISMIPLIIIVGIIALGAVTSGAVALGCLIVTPWMVAAAPWGEAGAGIFRQWAQTFGKALIASLYYAVMFIVALSVVGLVVRLAYSPDRPWPPVAAMAASGFAWLAGLWVMKKVFAATPRVSGGHSVREAAAWMRHRDLAGGLSDLRKGGKDSGASGDGEEQTDPQRKRNEESAIDTDDDFAAARAPSAQRVTFPAASQGEEAEAEGVAPELESEERVDPESVDPESEVPAAGQLGGGEGDLVEELDESPDFGSPTAGAEAGGEPGADSLPGVEPEPDIDPTPTTPVEPGNAALAPSEADGEEPAYGSEAAPQTAGQVPASGQPTIVDPPLGDGNEGTITAPPQSVAAAAPAEPTRMVDQPQHEPQPMPAAAPAKASATTAPETAEADLRPPIGPAADGDDFFQ